MANLRLKVDETYVSKCGNIIQLFSYQKKVEKIDEFYRGRILKTVDNMGALKNRTHFFTTKGLWLDHQGKVLEYGSIHDLEKEATLKPETSDG